MLAMPRLTVLDQSPVASGRTAADAIAETLELAPAAAEYGVGEFVIVAIAHDFKARLRSYQLLAEAFELL
jgi:hypothetical protein